VFHEDHKERFRLDASPYERRTASIGASCIPHLDQPIITFNIAHNLPYELNLSLFIVFYFFFFLSNSMLGHLRASVIFL
jgi:hypothetical protein